MTLISATDAVLAVLSLHLAQTKQKIQDYAESTPENKILASEIRWVTNQIEVFTDHQTALENKLSERRLRDQGYCRGL